MERKNGPQIDETLQYTHDPIVRLVGNTPVTEWLQRSLVDKSDEATSHEAATNQTDEKNSTENI